MLPEPRVVSSKVSNCHLVRPALERFLKYTVGDVMDPACAASLAECEREEHASLAAALAASLAENEREDEARRRAAAEPSPRSDGPLPPAAPTAPAPAPAGATDEFASAREILECPLTLQVAVRTAVVPSGVASFTTKCHRHMCPAAP